MEKEHGSIYVKRSQRDYSLSFKLGEVGEVECGELSQASAARKYGIQGNNTIRRRLQKFGTFDLIGAARCKPQNKCTCNKKQVLKPIEKIQSKHTLALEKLKTIFVINL